MPGPWISNPNETADREELVIGMSSLTQLEEYEFEVSDRSDFDESLGRVTRGTFTTAGSINRDLDFVIVNGNAVSGWDYSNVTVFDLTVTLGTFEGDINVSAGAVDDNASVSISNASTSNAVHGQSIVVIIDVTLQGGTRTYTLNINVNARLRGDFNTLSPVITSTFAISDIWCDGTTMWVLDAATYRVHGFNYFTAASLGTSLTPNPSAIWVGLTGNSDWILPSTNRPELWLIDPDQPSAAADTIRYGVNSQREQTHLQGSHLWATSHIGNERIDRYTVNFTAETIALTRQHRLLGNGTTRGIFHDGTHLWVVARRSGTWELQKWNPDLSSSSWAQSRRVAAYALSSDNGSPRGLWCDEQACWVGDRLDRKLYAYRRSDGSHIGVPS